MSPFLQFAAVLAIIIAAAKISGYISLKLGQPSVLGELIAGVILGPSLIDLLHLPVFTDSHLAESIDHLAEIGVLLLMFIAGLDLHLSDLVKSGKVAAFAGVLGVVVPLGMGYLTAIYFNFDNQVAIFTGLILAATSVSISAQTLMELGFLRTRVGISLLGAAVFDDILVVLGLSIIVALTGDTANGLLSVLWIAVRMILFLIVGVLIGLWLVPRLSQVIEKLPISQGLIAFTTIIILIYAWAAEILGSMAAITGAFIAGLVLARSTVKDRIEAGVSALAYGFFVPIFFVNVGLSANVRDLPGSALWLLLVMIVVSAISKLAGAGIGARLGGLTNIESLQLGAGMISRGEVGLIVATVGIIEGIIDSQVFSIVVGIVIVTTLITPPILRVLFTKTNTPTAA